jgi:hypothetical protein
MALSLSRLGERFQALAKLLQEGAFAETAQLMQQDGVLHQHGHDAASKRNNSCPDGLPRVNQWAPGVMNEKNLFSEHPSGSTTAEE